MANKVNEIIQDIQVRIGEFDNQPPYHHASILRAINRVYKRLNMELKCLEKYYAFIAGTFSSQSYIDKPTQLIMPFKFTDDNWDVLQMDYVAPEVFNYSSGNNNFSIIGDKIYFSNVDADSSFFMWYYGSGNDLVDKADADLGSYESNAPEWQVHYHDALYYGACIELKQDYPMYQNDVVQFARLRSALKESQYRKQMGVTPEIIGGISSGGVVDDYDIGGFR